MSETSNRGHESPLAEQLLCSVGALLALVVVTLILLLIASRHDSEKTGRLGAGAGYSATKYGENQSLSKVNVRP